VTNNNQEGTPVDKPMSTETFLFLCYKCGLTKADLETMTIGMCLDYVQEYAEQLKPDEEKIRKATQNDFDCF
jgi:hypothetical protein